MGGENAEFHRDLKPGEGDVAGETILIVDDSPSALEYAAFALRGAGYRVETTSEIWIAHLVRELRPRLVLMDVNLGSAKSGPAVVRGLNAMAIRKEMVVLFYSSQPEEELVRLVDECKADGYIRKGCSMEELEQRVTAALGN